MTAASKHVAEHGDARFSLIELMMATAVPVLYSSRSQSKVALCQENLRTIDGIASQYDIAHGDWPADVPPHAICTAGHTY